jgi:hypothetical protein
MRRDAAEAAGRLIAAANEALAGAQRGGAVDARLTERVGATSGYRGSEHQARLWRGYFPDYYGRTAGQRATLPGGPHGPAAVRHMIDVFRIPRWIAAPGYSNHQDGIAIDLRQRRRAGSGIRNSSNPAQLAAWRRSWLHGWLVQNAQTFGFQPYAREPWHWVFRGPSATRLVEASPAAEEPSETETLEAAEGEDWATGAEGEFEGSMSEQPVSLAMEPAGETGKAAPDVQQLDEDSFEMPADVANEADLASRSAWESIPAEFEERETEEEEFEAGELEDQLEPGELEDEDFEAGERLGGELEHAQPGTEHEASGDELEVGEVALSTASSLMAARSVGALETLDPASGAEETFRSTVSLLELEPELQNFQFVDRIVGVGSFLLGGPIRPNDTGGAVTVLQNTLRSLGPQVQATGTFDAATEAAVRIFKAGHGLCPTPIVQPQTKAVMLRTLSIRNNPSVDPIPEAIVNIARSQIPRWLVNGNHLLETDRVVTPFLQEYYRDGVCADIPAANLQSATWHASDAGAWSATFVSWVMLTAGAGAEFRRSRAHRVYVRAAKDNRCNNVANRFWAYRATEVAPEPGDLICRNRQPNNATAVTYENVQQQNILWAMHCDIVTQGAQGGNIMVTGGNVAIPGGNPRLGLTLAERAIAVQANGLVDIARHPDVMAIVRCRGRHPTAPQAC